MIWSKSVASPKPVNPSGMRCPLLKAAVCETCHTCEFWNPLEVSRAGKPAVEWRCAFNWSPLLQVINNSRMDGLQVAIESMRNRFADYAQMSARLLTALPKLMLGLPPPPPQEGGSLDARDAS